MIRSTTAASLLALMLVLPVPALAVTDDDLAAAAEFAARKDFLAAKVHSDAGRYGEAEALLRTADAAEPNNADILNLLGFVTRKQGRLAEARGYYDRALAKNPDHRGAREYRGELFVETGDLTAARAELAELERICGTTCEEYRELAEVLSAAGS
ncbi:tetratricopeptide repeat protein [Mongoliimonas terrestris]|uniref:tetratricopeptide repeat protein n=1 Tax=Mongoliimonas terrestris TaxID=1709001 RepID=UPI000949997A|nr:tetratricopeptide repeat protein [Mongoliimonas terrestris]